MADTGIINRIKAAARGFVYPNSMTWSGRGSWLSVAPRSFPYWNTDPMDNSAVVNTLAWITRNFGQAEFQVYRQRRDGEEEEIVNHPLQRLIERPNKFYGGQTLWAATLASYHLDGNAYWLKVRNARGFGVTTELWYEPHWNIAPHWPEDGSAYIDYYERHINGQTQQIPVENVVHFRNGMNPSNTRKGLAPLRSALLQVFTDQEVSLWVAALCRNMAIPGVMVNPTEAIGMTPEKAEQIKQVWKRKFGGDNRGEPLILDFPASVEVLGFDPKQMDFAAIHHLAESRIAGALGVPPQLTYLDVANESSSYNNLTTFERIGWEQSLIPAYENFEDTIDSQLLPDFEADPLARGIFTEFDTSDVRALKEDQNQKEQRAREAWTSGLITMNEAREALGYLPDPSGDFYFLPSNGRPVLSSTAMDRAAQEISDPSTTPPPAGQDDAPDSQPKRLLPAFFLTKAVEWEGMSLRREPSDLEKLIDIKQIAEAMAKGEAETRTYLLGLRDRWISELLDEFDDLDPADFPAVTVEPTEKDRAIFSAILTALFVAGAGLIVRELALQQGGGGSGDQPQADADAGGMSRLASATLSRLANDVAARAISSAVQAVTLGVAIADRIRADFDGGSTAYVDRAAQGSTNAAIARGREAEIRARGVELIVYSAVLDSGTCEPCGEVDGVTGKIDEIPAVPNPACLGGSNCRCVHIPVVSNLPEDEE